MGLAILLAISAASIGFEIRSRSDAARVTRTLEVINEISDVRLLMRRAESAARGFGLTAAVEFADDFRDLRERIAPALSGLKDSVGDNPDHVKLLEHAAPLIERRLEISAELIHRRKVDDTIGVNKLFFAAQGRALQSAIDADLDRMASEEERLLAIRTADSQGTRSVLLAIDLSGACLILLLAATLMRQGRSLQAAVAERGAHLVAAQEEIRRSAAVLQSTFQSMAEAVLVIDPDGGVMLSNPAAARMLRYKAGMNVQGLRDLSTAYHTDGSPIPTDDLPSSRLLRGEAFAEQEIVVRPHNEAREMHLVVSGRPLRDSTGVISGAALVYRDITASRETERKLQQAQKLEAIGKLTGGVAHDFNNMLTVITGATEQLVTELKDQPQLAAIASLIDDAAERCAELVKHLLAFARKQPLHPQRVDVNAVVRDTAKLLHPTLGKQIEIRTVLADNLAAGHIDPSQLANAVVNMAINARDAMPGGGKLTLSTANVVLDEACVAANPDAPAGACVMLAIADTGSGMAADVRERAFDPFFTTKEMGKGSGLGLSMVYGFVKQSGGHIKIDSATGKGTTIRLYLPKARN
jgi:PAS domain S-box-containing protein